MGDTFGGTWNRPGRRQDRQQGHGMRQLQDRAYNDNEPQKDCLSALFLMSVLATALTAAVRKRT